MRTINPRHLGPDEIAFCLETNGAIDARRFITFLDCLTRHDPDGPLPEFFAEILELSTGSFFGRLRFLWDSDHFDDDRMERIEETLDHIRTDLAAKDERADDRALQLAQQSLDVARAGNRTQRSMLAVAAASVILTFWQNARSEQESPCAEAVTAIMDYDGVSSVDLWCQGQSLRLHRLDVGLVVRRNGDDSMSATGEVHDAASQHDLTGEDLATPPPDIGRPTLEPLTVAATGTTTKRSPSLPRVQRIYGTAKPQGDIFRVTTNFPDPHTQTYLVAMPTGERLEEGKLYEISGRLLSTDDMTTLMIADEWHERDSLP